MAFSELRGLSREMYLRTQIDELRKIYASAQKKIAMELRSIDLTDFSRARSHQLLAQVDLISKSLDKSSYRWAKDTTPVAYNRGIDLAAERLRALKVTRFVNYGATIHTQAISILIDDVARELLVANEGMRSSIQRTILQSQQAIIQDSQISKLIAEGLIEGGTQRVVTDKILQELRAQMRDERFITIKGRNYRPETYAEMIARTRTREASSEATINTSLRYGVDLVQWDAHGEACEYCQQFSGRVYSISGADDEFPQLTEQPPLHPQCRCVITPITKENLEYRGYYDEVVKLSNAPTIKVDSYSRFQDIMAGVA